MSYLVGNYSVLHKYAGSYLAGATLSTTIGNRRTTSFSNVRIELLSRNEETFPTGYGAGAFVPAISTGGLSINQELSALGEISTAVFATGLNAEAAISASIEETDAILVLISSLEAAFSAQGSISTADLAIVLSIQASIAASGSITTAELSKLVALAAELQGQITISNTITNLVNLSADIGGPADLSPEGIANAVWDTVLADHQEAGSTGKALNDAGSAGNPWSAELASNNTAGTFGAFIQKLLTIAKFLGLK